MHCFLDYQGASAVFRASLDPVMPLPAEARGLKTKGFKAGAAGFLLR